MAEAVLQEKSDEELAALSESIAEYRKELARTRTLQNIPDTVVNCSGLYFTDIQGISLAFLNSYEWLLQACIIWRIVLNPPIAFGVSAIASILLHMIMQWVCGLAVDGAWCCSTVCHAVFGYGSLLGLDTVAKLCAGAWALWYIWQNVSAVTGAVDTFDALQDLESSWYPAAQRLAALQRRIFAVELPPEAVPPLPDARSWGARAVFTYKVMSGLERVEPEVCAYEAALVRVISTRQTGASKE